MIPGVVASQLAGNPPAQITLPPTTPDGAVIHVDFINGVYWDQGAFVDKTDLIDGQSVVTEGSGVFIGDTNAPSASQQFLDAFNNTVELYGGATFFIEWEITGDFTNPDQGPIIWIYDTENIDDFFHQIRVEHFGGASAGYMELVGQDAFGAPDLYDNILADTETMGTTPGTHKMAFTLAHPAESGIDEYAISIDGDAVRQSSGSPPGRQPGFFNNQHDMGAFSNPSSGGVGVILFGNNPGASWLYNNTYLRKITMFPPHQQADLDEISLNGEPPNTGG